VKVEEWRKLCVKWSSMEELGLRPQNPRNLLEVKRRENSPIKVSEIP
jgi:hypothetical protein